MLALSQTTASSPVIGPVRRQERIETIDILRGVAILGILIVNMTLRGFSLPEGLRAHELWPNMVDRTVETLILFFAAGGELGTERHRMDRGQSMMTWPL